MSDDTFLTTDEVMDYLQINLRTVYRLIKAGRMEEAREIYRWFRPLLDLDVSTYLVQNIKLAEIHAIGSNDRVRMPRQPLRGDRRARAERIVLDSLARRPVLPAI